MTRCWLISIKLFDISILWHISSWGVIQSAYGISNSIINTFDIYYFWAISILLTKASNGKPYRRIHLSYLL